MRAEFHRYRAQARKESTSASPRTRIELENPLHGFSHIFGSHRREADLCFIRFADEFRVFDGLLQSFLQNLRALVRRARRERESLGDFARIVNAVFNQLFGFHRLGEINGERHPGKSAKALGTVCSTTTTVPDSSAFCQVPRMESQPQVVPSISPLSAAIRISAVPL